MRIIYARRGLIVALLWPWKWPGAWIAAEAGGRWRVVEFGPLHCEMWATE